VGVDSGPADSVDTDSGPPTAATLGLTIILGGEEVAAAGATSLGSTSLPSNSLRARERVKWYAIIDKEGNQQQKSSSNTTIYLFNETTKMAATTKVNYQIDK